MDYPAVALDRENSNEGLPVSSCQPMSEMLESLLGYL
jgi:hypothetical protein